MDVLLQVDVRSLLDDLGHDVHIGFELLFAIQQDRVQIVFNISTNQRHCGIVDRTPGLEGRFGTCARSLRYEAPHLRFKLGCQI